MMEHHGTDNPWATILLSMAAGIASWLADPLLWRALAVAAACGFVGGVAKAAGLWAWNKARERRNARKG